MTSAEDISLQDVLDLVPYQVKKAAGQSGEMTIMCPLQPKSMIYLQVRDGKFKCFHECAGCPVNGKGQSVNLYRLYHPELNFKEAVEAISQKKTDVSELSRKKAPIYVPKEAKTAQLAPIETRNEVYRMLLGMLPLEEKHRMDLMRRGMTEAQIYEFGVKSLPTAGLTSIPQYLIERGYNLKGIPLFGRRAGKWQLCLQGRQSGYFIPYYDYQGRIEQLQIRYDVDLQQGMSKEDIQALKSRRYRWASSNGYEDGAAARNIPFWGRIGLFKDSEFMCITEGGLKASVASYISGDWFCAIPGVSCYDAFHKICKYAKRNHKTLIEAFDMDGKLLDNEHEISIHNAPANLITPEIREELARSNRFLVIDENKTYCRVINRSVRNSLAKLYQCAEEEGVEMIPKKWDPAFKGIDDYFCGQRYAYGKVDDWNVKQKSTAQAQSQQDETWCQESMFGLLYSEDTGFYTGTFMPVQGEGY